MTQKYRVRIIFDGLVAVGPPHLSRGADPSNGPLFGVMPFATRRLSEKAKRGLDSEAAKDPVYTSVHSPVIVTKTKPVETSRKPDDYVEAKCKHDGCVEPSCKPDVHVDPWYVWYPMRERMELAFDGDARPGLLTYYRAGNDYVCDANLGEPVCEQVLTTPQSSSPREVRILNIDAISDMRRIYPDRRELRKKMLSGKAPVAREVAAQVFVPRGDVSAGTDDDGYPYGVCVTYKPPQTKDPVQKCAAQQVVVTVANVNVVDIAMHSLDTGKKLDPISFVLAADSDIRIMNADPEAVRVLLEGRALTNHDRRGADIDFENYYRLLRGKNDGYLPVPYVSDRKFMLRPCYTTLVEGEVP